MFLMHFSRERVIMVKCTFLYSGPMLGFAIKVIKDLKAKIREIVSPRDELDRNWIGAKPVRTLRYVDADKKERKVLNRQASRRVTLPKSWLDRDIDGVDLHLMKDPKTDDVIGIYVGFVYDEKGKNND